LSFLRDPESASSKDVTNRGKAFYGHLDLEFNLSEEFTELDKPDLFLDFHGLGVKDLVLNAQNNIATSYFHHQRVYFDPELLRPGKTNYLSMSFKSGYRSDGEGAHYFKDTSDATEYIYTKFEPFFANRAIPVFDQPDIKATLKLRVIAPKEWAVIANGIDSKILVQGDPNLEKWLNSTDPSLVRSNNETYKLVEFHQTKKISTYLFAFLAGNYEYFQREILVDGMKLPLRMRLYFRKSVRNDAERVKNLMFEPVVQAMQWYANYFGHPYAFDKFDQIFCPEFSSGAMENVGAVTFTETYLFRGKEITESDRTALINTALHELAHMWFGNLVTMHWWDDLWLNEAFATFISYYAMSKIKSIFEITPSLWIQMNNRKHNGYYYDEISISHPICNEIISTDLAQDMLDGITYGKGSAFLQQLQNLIGENTFHEAIQLYFTKFSWENTYLEDFIGCLAEVYNDKLFDMVNVDIYSWAMKFLTTTGVNTLELKTDKTGIYLLQTKGQYSTTLIKQKLNILVFDKFMRGVTYSVLTSDMFERTNLPFSHDKGNMYVINDGDKAYTKTIFDDTTLFFLKENLQKIKDLITRTIAWRGILGMVKMRRLKAQEYFEVFENNIAEESHPVLLKNVLMLTKIANEIYTPEKDYEEIISRNFELVYEMLIKVDNKEIIDILNEFIFSF
jgi:aminopeptidase N